MPAPIIYRQKAGRKGRRAEADLGSIPGVGPKLAKELRDLGVGRVSDLRGRNPARLYDRLGQLRGCQIDRCVLYAFRCAVYFASESNRDPELLKWWNWKSRQYNEA